MTAYARRCCRPIPDEFNPCYASVLVYGENPDALKKAVETLESQKITSCFSAWCPNCSNTYMLTSAMDEFPCPSAHHTHQLHLLSVMRESGVFFAG